MPSTSHYSFRAVTGLLLLVLGLPQLFFPQSFADDIQLQPGDRIAIVGNTLADRMQHAAWLESLLHYHLPEHRLIVRDLGFSGDTITTRPRSDNFGTPEEWLQKVRADVVIACFGYNESWAGEAGLPAFRKELTDWLSQLQNTSFNSHNPPRVLLCSPTCYEDLQLPSLPDGQQINTRLQKYVSEMQAIAAEQNVAFVDLFAPTIAAVAARNYDTSQIHNLAGIRRDRFGSEVNPQTDSVHPELTINGVHLNDHGNRIVADVIISALIPAGRAPDPERLRSIRAAVLKKNLCWHNVYRATDGYSVFGGRSSLRFVGGQTNFEVMQQELAILEAMTANRDNVIHAAARGEQIEPADTNLPGPLAVQTNKPGRMDEGRHLFLGGKQAIEKMTVHSGMQVNLFASEEMFSDLVNPVQSAVDPDGRLWVSAWPTYPHWNPLEAMNDKLLILPDDDGDGVADRCITFADGLHNPTGFEFWNGGVLVAMAPDIFFLKDLDGDDRADIRERIFHGLDSADTHHTANAFVMSPGGKFYFSRGIFHAENFETPWGTTKRYGTGGAGVYEWDPQTFDINFHFPVGPNPHGDVFDQWGNQFATDGTGGTGNHIAIPGRGAPRQLYTKRVRPVPAITILDSEHFPEANRGNLLIANVIGFQGITQYEFEKRGAGFFAVETEPILYSSDPNFRPSDLEIGGDGALYVLDWQNPLIGHMQHNLRDPSRDHLHGRIYRVTATNRSLQKNLQLTTASTTEVVNALSSATLAERYRARLELSRRNVTEVLAATAAGKQSLDVTAPADARNLLELLWATVRVRQTDYDLLEQLLDSPVADARAAALRVLRDIARDISLTPSAPAVGAVDRRRSATPVAFDEVTASGRTPASFEEQLLRLAADPDAQVRADAVVAASFTRGPLAAEILFRAIQTEQDEQLTFVIDEARRVIDLQQAVRQTLAAGRKLTPAAQAWALSGASLADLQLMEPSEGVYRAILTRDSVPVEVLQKALSGLAAARKKAEIEQLFELIEELHERAGTSALNSLVRLLADQPVDQLQRVRDRIAAIASTAGSAEARRVCIAAWMNADGAATAVIRAGEQGSLEWREIFAAAALVTNRAAQQSLVTILLQRIPDLPGAGDETIRVTPGLAVDFFAPHQTNVAIETLEPLQPQASGTATAIVIDQPILTQRDAFALRFRGHLQIPISGEYQFFLSSDDGSRMYLDGELLINHDGLHEMTEKQATATLAAGLHPLTVTYYDNGGGDGLSLQWTGPGIERQALPLEALVTTADSTLQELAVSTLVGLPINQEQQVQLLIRMLQNKQSVATALSALAGLPVTAWKDSAADDIGTICVDWLARRPARERNDATADVVLALADVVKGKLQGPTLQSFESKLAAVVVPVIELGTVEERMIYDREMLVVRAGSPVVLKLANTDRMPHNLAIVRPGTLAEVGELAETTGRDADAANRQFIPATDSILAASRLLQPGQTDAIFFAAPQLEGIYPYVCTYPGHWRRMYGAMYVVADPQEFAADQAAYIAKHDLQIADELLSLLGRNTEWTLADLDESATHLNHRANNFAVGRRLFTAAACAGCHRLQQTGNALAPDLAKLPAEYKPRDVLDHILNPSKTIAEKYRSQVLVLKSGKVLTGLVVAEENGTLQLIDNPLAPDQRQQIRSDDIEEKSFSNVSIMPKGVLNKLNQEEILDLLAFVIAGGNAEHALFGQGAHQH